MAVVCIRCRSTLKPFLQAVYLSETLVSTVPSHCLLGDALWFCVPIFCISLPASASLNLTPWSHLLHAKLSVSSLAWDLDGRGEGMSHSMDHVVWEIQIDSQEDGFAGEWIRNRESDRWETTVLPVSARRQQIAKSLLRGCLEDISCMYRLSFPKLQINFNPFFLFLLKNSFNFYNTFNTLFFLYLWPEHIKYYLELLCQWVKPHLTLPAPSASPCYLG